MAAHSAPNPCARSQKRRAPPPHTHTHPVAMRCAMASGVTLNHPTPSICTPSSYRDHRLYRLFQYLVGQGRPPSSEGPAAAAPTARPPPPPLGASASPPPPAPQSAAPPAPAPTAPAAASAHGAGAPESSRQRRLRPPRGRTAAPPPNAAGRPHATRSNASDATRDAYLCVPTPRQASQRASARPRPTDNGGPSQATHRSTARVTMTPPVAAAAPGGAMPAPGGATPGPGVTPAPGDGTGAAGAPSAHSPARAITALRRVNQIARPLKRPPNGPRPPRGALAFLVAMSGARVQPAGGAPSKEGADEGADVMSTRAGRWKFAAAGALEIAAEQKRKRRPPVSDRARARALPRARARTARPRR